MNNDKQDAWFANNGLFNWQKSARNPLEQYLNNCKILRILVFAGLTQLSLAAKSQEANHFDASEFDRKIATMHANTKVPGMAVAVLQDGHVLHTEGYGKAGPNGSPVTPQTAFQIGSITKSFVALVILQLSSEGRIKLDDPVVRHLPMFRTADKKQSDNITIDHLVTHRSGLSTLEGNSTSVLDPTLSGPAAAVSGLVGVELFADPGSNFQYSNANYVVLSHLIEVLDNRRFEEALAARIFKPLGMTNSFIQQPATDATEIATGYRLWFGLPRPWQPAKTINHDRRMIGAGGIIASIEDLARYVEAVRTSDPRIVPKDNQKLFATNTFFEQWGYGYGWYTDTGRADPIFEHSGFTPGFYSLASMVPARGQVVVVLTNMSGLGHGDLPRAVTHAALGREQIPATASITAKIAIWSAVCAPLGLLLLLYKTGTRLLSVKHDMRPRARALNLGLAIALMVGTYITWVGFQVLVGVSFSTGFVFYPDLTGTAVVTMALLVVLAAAHLVIAIRGR